MSTKISVQGFIVSIQYRHLNEKEFLNFLLSAKDTYFDISTKESVSIDFGDEGDFETGAKMVEIRKDDGTIIKGFKLGNDDYVDYSAQNPNDKIFILKSINDYSADLFEGFEFNEFDAENATVSYNEGGSIKSLKFGTQNKDMMLSDNEDEIFFEYETEYEETYFECFILENKKAKSLDLDLIMEEITDGSKEIKEILNNINKYFF